MAGYKKFDVTFPDTTDYGRALQNYFGVRPANRMGPYTARTEGVNEEAAIRGVLAIAHSAFLWNPSTHKRHTKPNPTSAKEDYRKGLIKVQYVTNTDKDHQDNTREPKLF